MIPGNINTDLISGADEGGYQVDRSLRFNSADSAFLSRTPASAGNRKTWTWSGWVKRSAISFSAEQYLWGVTGTTDATYGEMFFGTGDTLRFVVGYNTTYGITTTRVFRDASAWYHIVLAFDATQSTAANKIKLYINGVEETTFSSDTRSSLANQDWGYNNNVAHYIGRNPNSDIRHFNGYLADIHFIDGQALTPASFAETNATTGQWVPKAYTGSYGTNGFRLDFSDNSAATATTLGKDRAGSNNWTPNNLSVTAGAGNDSLVDTPSSAGTDTGLGGQVTGNYCTWNPLNISGPTLSNGNLEVTTPSSGYGLTYGTIGISSGKWYWEITPTATAGAAEIGIAKAGATLTSAVGAYASGYSYVSSALKGNNNSYTSYGASYTTNDVIGVALDLDAGTLVFYKNNSSQGTAYSSLSGEFFPVVSDSSNSNGSTFVVNFGQRPFAYTAPSGFKALCDTNLPAPTIARPSTVMDVLLWTGSSTSSGRTFSGLNFSPDFVWAKNRSGVGYSHNLYDTNRGAGKMLVSNGTDSEYTNNQFGYISAFNSDGFTTTPGSSNNSFFNDLNASYVAWTWDAGSSTVTNTQGSITSQVRTNGYLSIVTYTGTGSAATVGHGLGIAPSMIIVKSLNTAATNWGVYHSGVSSTPQNSALNLDNASSIDTQIVYWNNTAPTSTVFSVGTWGGINGGTRTYVAYCFAPVAGYSAFGSYTGNGSTDGPFSYTGFRPRWILIKSATETAGWMIYDTARDTYNQSITLLYPNLSLAEQSSSSYAYDIVSNGFKVRNSGQNNTSSQTYIYTAFAESPFQYARAR